MRSGSLQWALVSKTGGCTWRRAVTDKTGGIRQIGLKADSSCGCLKTGVSSRQQLKTVVIC